MEPIKIYPDRIRAYGGTRPSVFCLVTNSEYLEAFSIEAGPETPDARIVAFDDGQSFEALLRDEIPEGAHILTILPNCLLHSVTPEVLGRRKLLIMACRSGKTDLAGIAHFLRAGERVDPAVQEEWAERFFERGELAPYLELRNDRYGTSARFDHMNDRYEWHEQLGAVDWGGQQVYPSGEVACFLVPLKIGELDRSVTFELDGQVALSGHPIVQSGPPSYLLEDQERIFERLYSMKDHAVVVDVSAGEVTAVEASHEECKPAAEMLEALFEVDSRFRRVYEIGFAMNPHVELWPGNCAMNEVYGGKSGTLHVGLGMLPHTQYHLDIFCEGTKVVGRDGEVIFGSDGARGSMRRRRSAACPCIEY